MRQYVLKRLCLVVPTLLLISIIVFSLNHMLPGDVVVLMFEEKAYAKDLDALRAKLGLDRPLYVQYFSWLGDVVQGNLGESLWTKRPVVEEMMRRLPVTFELGVMGIVVALTRSKIMRRAVWRSLACRFPPSGKPLWSSYCPRSGSVGPRRCSSPPFRRTTGSISANSSCRPLSSALPQEPASCA